MLRSGFPQFLWWVVTGTYAVFRDFYARKQDTVKKPQRYQSIISHLHHIISTSMLKGLRPMAPSELQVSKRFHTWHQLTPESHHPVLVSQSQNKAPSMSNAYVSSRHTPCFQGSYTVLENIQESQESDKRNRQVSRGRQGDRVGWG